MKDGANLYYLAVKHSLKEEDLTYFALRNEAKYHVFYPEGSETPFVAQEMVPHLLRDFNIAYPIQAAVRVMK